MALDVKKEEDNEGIKAYLEYIGSTDKTITSHRRPSINIKPKDNFLVGLSRKFSRDYFKPENSVFLKDNLKRQIQNDSYQDVKYKNIVYCMFSGRYGTTPFLSPAHLLLGRT